MDEIEKAFFEDKMTSSTDKMMILMMKEFRKTLSEILDNHLKIVEALLEKDRGTK